MLKLNFKNNLYKLIALCMLFFASSFSFANDKFYIKNYDVNIKVDEENRYSVKEKIDTYFLVPQRGIIRVIPTKYGKRNLNLSNINVVDNPYVTKSFSTSTNLRIGESDKYLTGDKSYTITYNYDLGDDFQNNYDEVYYNIIGDEWDTEIRKVNFSIELPKEFNKNKISFKSGVYGSTENASVTYKVIGNTIVGSTTKGLNPGEALTIALPLPEGYFKVTSYSGFLNILDKLIYLEAMFLPVIAILLWFLFGKNKKVVEVVEFYPPDNMNPMELGYYVDAKLNPKDLTSLIVYWAGKGFLDIHEEGKKGLFSKIDYILEKKNEIKTDKEYERYFFDNLFSFSNSGNMVYISSLRDNFYKHMDKTVTLFEIDLAMTKKRLYTKQSRFWGSIISAMPLLFLFTAMIKFSIEYGIKLFSPEILGVIPYILTLYPLIIPITFFLFFMSSRMKKRTEEYSSLLGRIRGFKRFLTTVEKDKLEMLVDENPSYFFDILPYTIVMNISDKWADKFKELTVAPPRWYHSSNMGAFNTLYFMSAMNTTLNNFSSNMYSRPGSNRGPGSSSMGGGSSGGGAGGGGGSSW